MEQPVSYYRPSYHSLPPKPRPQRPGLKLDDIDDIDVFNFYNPCLLPPSPIRPAPARASTDPDLAELPAYTREASPCPAPGLRRSTFTVRGRGRSVRRNTYAQPSPRSRSPSPLPPYTPEIRPPSPLHVRQHRSDSIQDSEWEWDASSSVYSDYSISTHEEQDIHHDASSEGESTERELEEEYLTPYLRVRPDDDGRVNQDGYHEREQAALRELWGVIDGLLGPGRSLGDFDAKSIASITSSMDGLGNGADRKRQGSEETTSVYGMQHEAAWWRAFRQGLLLS